MSANLDLCPGVFVTGTDTGVGKTLVAAALAQHLRNMGLRVGVMKPLETGVENPAEEGPDATLLRWASETSAPRDQVAPVRLRAPLAPSMAAEMEKTFVDFGHLVETSRQLRRSHDFVIVEGAGGLMVPIAGGLLIADLVRAMELPLMVVCRPTLGTINHTLLTLFTARQMDLPTAGFLVNNMPLHPDKALSDTPHTLAALASADLLGVFDNAPQDNDRQKVKNLSEQLASLPTYKVLRRNLDWPEIGSA